jgi:hypothetical protein
MRRVLRLGLIGWMGWWIVACQTAPPPHASKELSWAEIQRLVRTCPVSLPMTFLKPPLGVGGNYSNPQQTLFTHIPEGGKLVFKAPRQRGYRGAWPTDMYPGPWPIDIGKWPGSLLPLYPLPDGSIPIKWGWDRVGITGTLQIEGRRLDAPAPPLRAHVPPGYGDTGFQVSTLIFPTEGCWEVTGRVGSHTLTFVVLVLRLRPFPERGRDPCPICSDPSGGLLADLSGALRLVLGGVLLRAFVAKARVPRRFIEAVRAYALLPGIAPIAAGGLLLAEPVLALALLTGWGGALAWDATVILLGLFLIAGAVNLHRGRRIPCGCFGSASETISYHTLARLVLLALAALVARLLHPAYPDLSIARAGAAAALAALLLVGGLWLLELPSWIRLFRRPISPQER